MHSIWKISTLHNHLFSLPKYFILTGHLARFASGAAVASVGDSAVLSTCVFRESTSEGQSVQDFVPFLVDFKQSAAAVGKIPTNYLRRELGQTDADILASRVIDRSLRPLFPQGWTNETQIVVKPLAVDDESDVVLLGLNAAAAALHLSAVPWLGPAAAVRIALVGDKVILNPNRTVMKESSLDLLLTGCGDQRTVMIEMDGKARFKIVFKIFTRQFFFIRVLFDLQVPLEMVELAINEGLNATDKLLIAMNELRDKGGKEKAEFSKLEFPEDLKEEVRALSEERLYYILTDPSHDKISRDEAIKEVGRDVLASVKYDNPSMVQAIFQKLTKKALRDLILDNNMRCDGRSITDFRPITISVDVFKRLHGSSLFQRGQTQVMSTVTFDSPAAAFHSDSISQLLGSQRKKMFMLHYEFPSYATNEISTSRGANRRELGHGALAEKALKHVVPKEFPYSIRLACQVLESNGSSSMASACGGSLALLDAGVPLSASVAGVAIGMITDNESNKPHKILTDISGIEDYAGDMDFKIAGTSQGFTAMQLDVKVPGLTREQLSESLARAKTSVNYVLDKMSVIRDRPRAEFKPTVPVIETMRLDAYKRQALFRAGGMHAKTIDAETGTKIFQEDDAHISLFAPNKQRLEDAKALLQKSNKPHKILTDISGIEDYAGDMDFKIAGTSQGFTAMQLDVKVPGLTREQLSESLARAKTSVNYVLDKMSVIRDRPRAEFKPTVPVIETMRLDAYKRQALFRAGGMHAKTIDAETGTKIFQEDDAHISLFAPNKQRLEDAKALLQKLLSETDEPEFAFGQMVSAEVVELLERGAMLKLAGMGRPIFVPNSQLHSTPIKHSTASGLQVGQKTIVQYLGRDADTGQIRLSRKTIASVDLPLRSPRR
ncbi:putative polyribonucleotide nucleotidyltransferase [Oesophagostomum dentatum]|uniref:polyribonucleotide nucleotidyltransferase n=1 Tax=Oesophagostomum dentatum TaxID=61180 RepID=A0A0B1TKR5_OESDE|nr:putative polyribonucleotide nucleotidyltransferase [Oesophagostomum dentatum]